MLSQTLSRIGRLAGALALWAGLMGPGTQAGAKGIFVVQLASVKSEAKAKDAWARLQKRHSELLGGLDLMLQRADLGDRGVYFRMQAGPFPSHSTAVDMCHQIKAADMDCLVRER